MDRIVQRVHCFPNTPIGVVNSLGGFPERTASVQKDKDWVSKWNTLSLVNFGDESKETLSMFTDQEVKVVYVGNANWRI